jgi:hypothetical protein
MFVCLFDGRDRSLTASQKPQTAEKEKEEKVLVVVEVA